MAQYKTSDLQLMFDVSGETIRSWSNEFRPYLSPTATPGKGRYRLFSDDDVSVFALIAELKRHGRTFEDVHAALKSGQRGDLPALLESQTAPLESNAQLALAHHQLAQMKTQHDAAIARTQALEHELIRVRTQLEMLQDQGSKIDELNQEIGRLKALLEVERKKTSQKD